MFLAAAVIALAVLCGCEKEEDSKKSKLPGESAGTAYVGDVVVSGAMPFTDPGVEWVIEKQENGSYTLLLNKTKFAEAMPVRMDMEVRGMANQGSGSAFRFETPSIVPYYNGEQQEARTMTNFRCTADGKTMEVAFICMGLNVEYKGTAK